MYVLSMLGSFRSDLALGKKFYFVFIEILWTCLEVYFRRILIFILRVFTVSRISYKQRNEKRTANCIPKTDCQYNNIIKSDYIGTLDDFFKNTDTDFGF